MVVIDKLVMQKAAETFTADEILNINIPTKIFSIDFKLPRSLHKWYIKLVRPLNLSVFPPMVGTMYRVAGRAFSIPDSIDMGSNSMYSVSVLDYLDIASYAAGILIKNEKTQPSPEEQAFFEDTLSFADLQLIAMASLMFTDLNAIYAAYGLKKEKSAIQLAMQSFEPTEEPTAAESLPQYNVGLALKYFKGSITENDLKWNISWANYMLYVGSIPESPEVAEKHKGIEVKDADEIF